MNRREFGARLRLVCWALPVETAVKTGYRFGVSTQRRIEWLWLIQHRMTAKLK
jgi:hypothetical protein